MMCIVTGLQQYSEDLPQGGLEIPFCYTFKDTKVSEREKARKIIKVILSVEIGPTVAVADLGGGPPTCQLRTYKRMDVLL